MRLLLRAVACAALALPSALPLAAQAPADGNRAYIATEGGRGRFALSAGGKSAPFHLSANDLPGVARAAGNVRLDLGRVTGALPTLSTDSVPSAREVVIAGTLGRHPLIDRLVRERKLDATRIVGRWEAFVLQVIERPVAGVDRALVIAGSDRRGTIFGLYDLSAKIGVSPWYWWADVPVRRQTTLYVLPGRHTQDEPLVKYRGIFINDEAPALSGWTREKFGGFNHLFYEKVFELVLRLKGNYLWPAMWGSAFADDDSLSARLADEYGIVMGTSHHEPLTRAQAEWRRYGTGPWNYEVNDSVLREFWRGGVQRMGTRENIVTVGMRGDGDMPMTEGSNLALLQRIVADQRKIIAAVTGKDPSATPQLWALYKEVQDYYDRGMRVPDDITLLFADDNWGNIRRLPAPGDTTRRGGFGVYYHFDYVGGPRNYKWLNTNPIARVWEQMHLAWQYGASRIWIVNVGDIKPMEYPMSFFLDYAWNPARWPAERLPEYARAWAAQQFGAVHAAAIADIFTAYLKFAGRRKPELLAPETYSLTQFREAEIVALEWQRLRQRAERLQSQLPGEYGDAFYQLVLHPIEASANLNELYFTVAKNRRYALQGRASTNALADHARQLFERDAEITRRYHTDLAGGKWSHLMDQTHIGYTYWQEPPRNAMPRVDVIQVPVAAEMGVSWEGQSPPGPPGPGGPRPAVLPELDPYQHQSYSIDIYNRGQTSFDFSVTTGEPWLRVTPERGTVTTERRLTVRVDWSRTPNGRHRVPITITGSEGRRVIVQAPVHNPLTPRVDELTGFVQGNGLVAMEAEHFTNAVAAAPLWWQRIPDLGRTLSGMTPFPVTAESQVPGGTSPRLEYRAFLFDSGDVRVRAHVSPTLNFTGRREGVRYAVSFDDEPPQIVNITADSTAAGWERSVADNIKVLATRHRLAQPGYHTLKFWMVDPGVVLQRLVIETRDVPDSYLGPPESFRGSRTATSTSPRVR
ncbi:MAG: glycosyl hydrolase 115 family protein [Gemmatimonadaceae bacterium]